jgi:hypothetical protein
VQLKIPFTPFDKLMTGFDKLRANGILNRSTAVFRFNDMWISNQLKKKPRHHRQGFFYFLNGLA